MKTYVSMQILAQTPLEQLASVSFDAMHENSDYPIIYYWLWLADVCCSAHPNAKKILETFGDAKSAYEQRETTLFTKLLGKKLAEKAKGMSLNAKAACELVEYCKTQNIYILYVDHPNYPKALKQISNLPLVLYATGDLTVLEGRKYIGMVGTRRPTDYGVSSAERFGTAFAKAGAVVVSGLADGLDGASHRAVTRQKGQTIAVLGSPINKTFPASHGTLRKEMENLGGLTISEYAPFYATGAWSFPPRNRIIAALSDALVVMEARLKSGTLITVRYAEKYKTPVYAVPGSVFSALSEGTNALLATQRAKILINADDVLAEIGMEQTQKEIPLKITEKAELSPQAQQILLHIGARPIGLSAICEKSGMPMGAVLGALSELEIKGKIIVLPGRQYVLK